jgi:protoporphyrin/coproporphyrin ferrochelatase
MRTSHQNSINQIAAAGKFDDQAQDYDAILIVSFGGPESMNDIMPFLENVLRGRHIPHERKLAVSRHYEYFDGISPINAQNRALIVALRQELEINGPNLPIYWGNRNWHPLLTDTLRQMRDDGIKRALALFTFAHSCYSSCRQYLEDISQAQAEVGKNAPEIDRIRFFYNHPGFIEPNIENLRIALDQFPSQNKDDVHIAFVAHSLPVNMADNSPYVAQLTETCRLIAESIQHTNWRLVYQSRSGAPHHPWLEPDICDYLEELHSTGVKNVTIMPVGFISDHMEIVYDLDTEATRKAEDLGLKMVRAATVGTHPVFIKMIRELIMERMVNNPERRALGTHGPHHDICGANCCLPK